MLHSTSYGDDLLYRLEEKCNWTRYWHDAYAIPNNTFKKTAAHSIMTRLKLRLKQSGKMLHSINRVSQLLIRLQF